MHILQSLVDKYIYSVEGGEFRKGETKGINNVFGSLCPDHGGMGQAYEFYSFFGFGGRLLSCKSGDSSGFVTETAYSCSEFKDYFTEYNTPDFLWPSIPVIDFGTGDYFCAGIGRKNLNKLWYFSHNLVGAGDAPHIIIADYDFYSFLRAWSEIGLRPPRDLYWPSVIVQGKIEWSAMEAIGDKPH